MMDDCMILDNEKKDGTRMRPSSAAITHHWTYMLTHSILKDYADCVQIRFIDNDPHISINQKLKDRNINVFEHLMKFAKMHNIDFVVNVNSCSSCSGHDDCLANAVL